MIQEKDFLYRVPVKTAPITTPGGQIRNPEILVDLEGGEFIHGNILDANSTNKLINQSVKDAVDNKLIESGFVTKDLLEAETTRATEQENSLKTLIGAETSARTKGDEDLSSKIKAEQTRAEGKEKEISDKLAIVNGDSNTEGSFRKAIADVVAAAPEDLDTLKEIADKLAGNDDLHTALNQAITEKADASALLNEVTRATGVESALQAAIATKADATALSNYVLTTALNQQVDTLNADISEILGKIRDKQDAGNYITYEKMYNDNIYNLEPFKGFRLRSGDDASNNKVIITYNNINVANISDEQYTNIDGDGVDVYNGGVKTHVAPTSISGYYTNGNILKFSLDESGVLLRGGDSNHVLTSNASTIDITEYAKKTELPTVPTKTSQLTNDSNFMAANVVQNKYFGLEKSLRIYNEADNKIMNISHHDIILETNNNDFVINENGFFVSRDSDGADLCSFTPSGIRFEGKTASDIPTAGGDFIELSSLASAEDVSSLRVGMSKKQNKITVNTVDITDIETADVTKLRTIVTNLINALSSSGLINTTDGVE